MSHLLQFCKQTKSGESQTTVLFRLGNFKGHVRPLIGKARPVLLEQLGRSPLVAFRNITNSAFNPHPISNTGYFILQQHPLNFKRNFTHIFDYLKKGKKGKLKLKMKISFYFPKTIDSNFSI